MKGIILAGGTGSRLFPLTKITNKHLLPVYDKPMICYPLNTLINAGIDDIMIVSGRGHVGHFLELLGSGSELGVRLSYEIQDGAGGIAQALGLAQRWAGDDAVTVILGDNIFEDSVKDAVQSFKSGARIFLKEVSDAQRFGVAEVAGDRIVGIVEKPQHPKTNLADIRNAAMTFSLLSGFWSDAGTFDSLLRASMKVKEYREKQGRP
ncbi:MAG: sugar phosphate nucleotidyltransferase [Methanoregula sp.]|uniref:sugar phosphate nucleotidyltransferase n=1 Tax=Methanoregula sp. TaxID=2052170 RepID=UPI003C293D5A